MKKKTQDAYGRGLWDYYTGKNTTGQEIVERDDGYISAGSYGPKRYLSEYRQWSDEDKIAIKYAFGKVLDIGCGAGRHGLYLQKKGFDVTGIDNSPYSIRICKQRGLKKARVLDVKDVDSLRGKKFDSVLLLGHNIGLLGSIRRGKTILRKLHKITSDEALIIADGRDPYKKTSSMHRKYHTLNRKRGRMSAQLRLRIRYQDLIGPWFDYLFVSRKELEGILKGTGWKIKKFISRGGDYIVLLKKV